MTTNYHHTPSYDSYETTRNLSWDQCLLGTESVLGDFVGDYDSVEDIAHELYAYDPATGNFIEIELTHEELTAILIRHDIS